MLRYVQEKLVYGNVELKKVYMNTLPLFIFFLDPF